MIRTATASAPVRIGLAAAGIAGALALAGCTPPDTAAAPEVDATTPQVTPAPDSAASEPASGDSVYAEGTYTAEGSYATPESVENIVVTVTLEDDVVTDVEVTGDPQKSESVQYQGQFIGGIAEVVVGQNIDSLSVSRVAGSSLTSGGFNQAIEAIRSDAAA